MTGRGDREFVELRWSVRLEARFDEAAAPSDLVADRVREGLRMYRSFDVVARAGELAVTLEVGPTSDLDSAVTYAARKLASVLSSAGLTDCPVTVSDVRCIDCR